MSNYNWNLSSIRKKKKYVLDRLKCVNLTDKEKEELEMSLIGYVCLLQTGVSKFASNLKNVLQKVTNGKLKLTKEEKYAKLEYELVQNKGDYVDDDYLQFLLDLAQNIADGNTEEITFTKMEISDKELIDMSKKFYTELDDNDIKERALKTLDNPELLHIREGQLGEFENYGGLTIYDHVFDEAYCSVARENTIFDYQILNHEIMHSVDFYSKKKLPSETYYGFHEVPTYTIDYLFIDYLEKQGFDKKEVQKLRMKKNDYLKSLANMTLLQIKLDLVRSKGISAYNDLSVENVKEHISFQTMKQLLEVESGLIAYGFYKQISIDKKRGIDNIKTFMEATISLQERPDFSNYGFTDEDIMSLSKEFDSYSQRPNIVEYIEKPTEHIINLEQFPYQNSDIPRIKR